MFNIIYSHLDYSKDINEIAKAMDTKLQGDTLLIPEQFAKGYLKHLTLSNGLQCMLSDYTLHQDMYMQRNKSDNDFYILHFDEISISGTLTVKIDNDYTWEEDQNRASVLLTSSAYDFAYQTPKGTAIKSINVLVARKWLAQYLDIKSMDNILEKYLQLKTAAYNFVPFDIEYRTLFNEVMDADDSIMINSILGNRIMMLVERFLTHLYQRMNEIDEGDKVKLSADEIKRLMEVESYLVKDFSTPPPPISFLSRVAAMSVTTLKNKFKKLYGNNLYEYFQKSRMHKAKILLQTKKYSIKEIGSQLGYSNLSNFAAAFKKEFKRLPSKLGLK